MAMSQAHTDGNVKHVFVVPGVQLPPAVHDLLEKRYPGMVQRIDPRAAVQITSLSTEEQTLALKVGGAIGLLLAAQRPTIPAIDFVNPRKRIEAPDNRKAKMRAYGGGLALLALLGVWMNMSAVSAREKTLADLKAEAASVDEKLKSKSAKTTKDSSDALKRWKDSDPRPMAALEKLTVLLPPTSELIFSELYVKPGKPITANREATAAGIRAFAWVKTQEAIDQLEDRLASSGYNVTDPAFPEQNKFDPDYPLLYELNADQLIPKPAPPPKPAAPAAK